jgi:preprotein translocase subunit SecY
LSHGALLHKSPGLVHVVLTGVIQQAVSRRPVLLSSTWWLRLAVTALCLVIWRLLATIPLPIVGTPQLAQASQGLTVHGPLALLTGPPLERMSLVAMGLEPFFDALVIFWLLGVASSHARKARDDPKMMWQYLTWLAAILASLRAFGLVTLLTRGQAVGLSSPAGLASLFGLVVGSMALLAMGRLIDCFGVPGGYGVWFLFGIDGLLQGVHSVGTFVGRDHSDPQLAGVLLGYAVTSVVLISATIVMVGAVGQVRDGKTIARKRRDRWRTLPIRFLVGAFILPVVIATQVIIFPLIPLEGLLGFTAQQINLYWSPQSSIVGVALAYDAVYCVVVVAACFISMQLSLGSRRGGSRSHRPKTPSSTAPADAGAGRFTISSVTLALGLWMAAVVVLVPVASTLLLGPRPRLPVGGGPFVVTAAVLINVAYKLRAEINRQLIRPSRAS